MPTTPVHALPYPQPSDPADVPADMQKLALAVDGGLLPSDTVVVAATRIIRNLLAAGDANPAWQVRGDGRMQWGAGGSNALDVNLYRDSAFAATLASDSGFQVKNQQGFIAWAGSASASSFWFRGRQALTDTQNAFQFTSDGAMKWGVGGSTAPDVTLLRYGSYLGGIAMALSGPLIAGYGSSTAQVAIGVTSSSAPAIGIGNAGDLFLLRGNVAGAGYGALLVQNGLSGNTQQSNAMLNVRRQGNQLEFGHSNPNGYGSTLGCLTGSGAPFLAFYAEEATSSNLWRSRGVQPSMLNATGNSRLGVYTLPSANADNQTAVFGQIDASAFNVQSDRTRKQAIRDVSRNRADWHDVLMRARPYTFKRYAEDSTHIGLMADELPAEVTVRAPGRMGDQSVMVDVYKLCTVLLGSLQLLEERLARLEGPRLEVLDAA